MRAHALQLLELGAHRVRRVLQRELHALLRAATHSQWGAVARLLQLDGAAGVLDLSSRQQRLMCRCDPFNHQLATMLLQAGRHIADRDNTCVMKHRKLT